MTFKVGQRITYSGRVGHNRDYYSQIKGTVIYIDPNHKIILVEFDRNVGGHPGLRDDNKESRWWFEDSVLSKGIESSNVCVNVRKLI